MQESDITIRSEVDSGFLDEAEKEIYEILLKQSLSYSERWYSNKFLIKTSSFLRIFGLVVSLLAFAFCVFVLLINPSVCPAWKGIEYYTLAFLVLAVIFYFLPAFEKAIKQWGKNYAPGNCRKLAARCVRQARDEVPYTAEYTIRGNSLIYNRVKDDGSHHAWTRRLKGVAIHGRFVTVLFRKWTSFSPGIIILHNDYIPMRYVLNNANIKSKVLDLKL